MPSVGLDVHAKESTGVVLDPVTGEVSCRRVRGVPEGAVLDWLVSLPRPFRVVYEAGPTGYGLARAAAARGIDIRVCSPGHVQKRAGDRIKTDRRDAEHLARLLIADELVVVRVPSVEEEQFRDLVRAREDIRQDLMRVRHRLSKFLLRRAIYYPQAGAAWTLSHRDWLAKLVFDDRPSMAAFTDQVHAHDGLLWRRDALDREISVIVQASPWQDTVSRFRCFRGIDTLTAAGIQAEIGDWSRFSHPKQVGVSSARDRNGTVDVGDQGGLGWRGRGGGIRWRSGVSCGLAGCGASRSARSLVRSIGRRARFTARSRSAAGSCRRLGGGVRRR